MSERIDPQLVQQVMAQVKGKTLESRLPCGCEIGPVGDALVFRPCSMRCKYAVYAVEESRRQGKPLNFGYENGN